MNSIEKREIIISCVIGDGYINKKKSISGLKYNYRLVLTHGNSQKDYLEWKNNLLYSTGIFKNNSKINSYNTRLNEKTFLQHSTVWCNNEALSVYHDLLYVEGEKTVCKALKHMKSSLSLALLFMDDGSVFKRKRKRIDGSIYFLRPSMKLCTHSFDYDDNQLIISWLKYNFDIEAYIVIERKRNREGQPQYYTLNFNCDNSCKVWNLISRYVEEIDSMKEKFSFIRDYYMKIDQLEKT